MREFVVILRGGTRYTVRAERIVWEPPYVAFVLSRVQAIGEPNTADTVAMFDQHEVSAVVSREHLVSEEKGDPIVGPQLITNDPIPF